MNTNRIVIPDESYHDEIVTTAIMAFEYNELHGYYVRNWENASEGHTAWIKELAYDPRIMLLAHGIGAERALCKMLGLPYNFGMGEYRSHDIPPLPDGRIVDNKNSWAQWATIKVNKEAVDQKIKNDKRLPDLFSLVTGMLTRKYFGIGFIRFEDIINKAHLQPGKQDKDGKWHPYYEAEQRELWWLDEEFATSYMQAEMFA